MKFKYLSKTLGILFVAVVISAIGYAETALALAPPTEEMIEQMIADGTYEDRVNTAYEIGNNQTSTNLIQKLSGFKATYLPEDKAVPPQIPPAWQNGMPSIGENKVLTILVDFPDYPHSSSQTVEEMTDLMYGAENENSKNYPYESLAAYYERSSYGKLKLSGEVWGWYRAPRNSTYYENSNSYDELIESAIEYFIEQGKDITPYDNNGDGIVEAIYLKWTVPSGDWSSYWWACTTWYSGKKQFQNRSINRVVWMPYHRASRVGAETEIHEFGHVLGLPDLYDYDITAEPSNCTAYLDMMAVDEGDHNAFSKFLLGWLEPIVIGTGSADVQLRPTSEYPDAVLIMPGATFNACNEFYIAQYRTGTKNDRTFPYIGSGGNGLVIWHIDATLDRRGYDFMYNNSASEHPFVSLVAKGVPQSEAGFDLNFSADENNIYRVRTDAFTPFTVPNSNNWDKANTGVSINNISLSSNSLSATYSVSTNTAPKLIYAEYEKSMNAIVLTYDCFPTVGTNLSGITVNGKNIGAINYSASIKNNKIILALEESTLDHRRYNISIPQNAVKNSDNIPCDAETTAVITPPNNIYKDNRITILNTNKNVFEPDDSAFVIINGVYWNQLPYLSYNMGLAGYDLWIRNNDSETVSIQPILAYYVDNTLVHISLERIRNINPYATSSVWGYVKDFPDNYVDDCVVKLFLWEEGTMYPLSSAYVLQ